MFSVEIEIFEYGKLYDRQVQFFNHITAKEKHVILPEDRTIDTSIPETEVLKHIQDYIEKNGLELTNIKETSFEGTLFVRFYLIRKKKKKKP
ncbi:MAG: hypothetical protein ACXAD7_08210, partial [Candidatus Kariarchaeaceae archaeon]